MLYREIIAVCSEIQTTSNTGMSVIMQLSRSSVMENRVKKVTGLMEEVGMRTENLGEAFTKHHASSLC